MKRIIAIILALIFVVSLCGCTEGKQEKPEQSVEESEILEAEPSEVEDLSLRLEPLFCGIYDLEERAGSYGDPQIGGGSFVPMRFSHERIENYEQYGATAKVGTPYFNCTTGVRMDFYTDAPEISFSYVVKESFFDRSSDHPDDCFALFEDGQLKETYLVQNGTDMDLVYKREAEGESRITIVFPNWHGIVMRNINLGNARPYDGYEHNFLFLGDSIAQGLFADNPSESWTNLVASHFNANYFNRAVGGEVFRTGSLDKDDPFKPTHIFISLGVNDFYSGVTQQELAKNCADYIMEVQEFYPDIPITLITSFNTVEPQSWTDTMLSVAEGLGCNVIDGTGFASSDADSWNVDRVHPSSKGFKEISEKLIPLIEPLL